MVSQRSTYQINLTADQRTTGQRIAEHLNRYWFAWFNILYALFVGLPWLAPLLMHVGAVIPGRVIYAIYSFLCHQLPERSFFLFGPKATYSLVEIQSHWQQTVDPMILRQYIGDVSSGWKVAWSDRMMTMYTSVLFFAWLWWPLRKKIRPLPLFGFILLALPMFFDGASHMISDFAGLNEGFRYTNSWLAALTGNAFPAWFYYGDALGSFNSWMRLITGALFGMGAAWFLFPIFDRGASAERLLTQAREDLKERLLQGNLAQSAGNAQLDPVPTRAINSNQE